MEAHDVEVEKEQLQGPKMKLVCAWHPKYFGTEKVIREAESGASPGVTHGICEECREKTLARKSA